MTQLTIDINSTCNIRCEFCYQELDGRSLNKQEVLRLVDEHPAASVVNIGGGEPFLHPEILANVERLRNREHKFGQKTTKEQRVAVFDATVAGLEREIEEYRRTKHDVLGRHDRNLIRTYANITYIAPENPQRQLETKPPTEDT